MTTEENIIEAQKISEELTEILQRHFYIPLMLGCLESFKYSLLQAKLEVTRNDQSNKKDVDTTLN